LIKDGVKDEEVVPIVNNYVEIKFSHMIWSRLCFKLVTRTCTKPILVQHKFCL